MALTDQNDPFPAPARPLAAPASQPHGASRDALGRLSQIHAETFEAAQAARFLRSAVNAGALLLVCGGLALALAGGAGIQTEFAWTLAVLAGVGAMLRAYIKSSAQGFDRTPLREAAKDLRAVLAYTGVAWGAGAFLLLGANPIPFAGLCFAILPTLGLAMVLKDRTATLSFLAPVTALSAAAILLDSWSAAPVALVLLLTVQGGLGAGVFFAHRPAALAPAGLSLR